MRKKWRKMKKEVRSICVNTQTRELITKGVLTYVYEVPEPEHIFIKVNDHIVYDFNDGAYYMPSTESIDQLVSGYQMDIGYLSMLRRIGLIGRLV